jgi:hypothetical protein
MGGGFMDIADYFLKPESVEEWSKNLEPRLGKS